MKIAVVGSGAAGLGASLALSEFGDVRLFEKAPRFGGHANTVEVEHDGARIAVDTGFIVYNRRNYPNLTALFDELGVATKWSDMSFGFSLDDGRLEYACDDLNRIFAQRRNLLRPTFLLGFRDVLRFCQRAPGALADGSAAALTLGEWLAAERFSDWFRERFIVPMGAAIWSTPASQMLAFPAESFLRFFANHDLYTGLDAAQRWRTVEGGSREYVSRIVDRLGERAHRGLGVVSVRRPEGRPLLSFSDGSQETFDHVVLCGHAPQNAAVLHDMDDEEGAILSAFRTTPNRAVLHRDESLMPRNRRAWSSWSLIAKDDVAADAPVSVSYWMNRLQGIDRAHPLFVSLNPLREPRPDAVFAEFDYDHPLYDRAAFDAQARMDDIQGRGGVWHAGAWLGYGFHEDALRTGLRAAAAIGARPAWARDLGAPLAAPLRVAAE